MNKQSLRSKVSDPDRIRHCSASMAFYGYPKPITLNFYDVPQADFAALPGKANSTTTRDGKPVVWKKLLQQKVEINFFRADEAAPVAEAEKAGGQ